MVAIYVILFCTWSSIYGGCVEWKKEYKIHGHNVTSDSTDWKTGDGMTSLVTYKQTSIFSVVEFIKMNKKVTCNWHLHTVVQYGNNLLT